MLTCDKTAGMLCTTYSDEWLNIDVTHFLIYYNIDVGPALAVGSVTNVLEAHATSIFKVQVVPIFN
jgi:hypothetical protein